MITEMVYITVIICFCIDVSGFMDELKRTIAGISGRTNESIALKPFDCSQCMSWWACIIYMLLTSRLSISGVVGAALLSWSAPLISAFMLTFRSLAVSLINKLTEWI